MDVYVVQMHVKHCIQFNLLSFHFMPFSSLKKNKSSCLFSFVLFTSTKCRKVNSQLLNYRKGIIVISTKLKEQCLQLANSSFLLLRLFKIEGIGHYKRIETNSGSSQKTSKWGGEGFSALSMKMRQSKVNLLRISILTVYSKNLQQTSQLFNEESKILDREGHDQTFLYEMFH